MMRGRFLRHARNFVGALMLGIPAVQHKGAGNVSGIGISYGRRRRSGADVALTNGGRLYEALRDGQFVLVVPNGVRWRDRRTHIRVVDAAVDKLTLVRPDGYAAWSGPAGDRESLAAAVATWS